MSSTWQHNRSAPLQCVLTLIGVTAFCWFSHSWYDAVHLLYDIPAGLATFAFVAQLPIELRKDGASRFWLYRLAVLLAMTIVTVGRQYRYWPISGHLSCVLAIASVQTTDSRLSLLERVLYWVPVPIVLGLRLFLLEQDGHWGTWNAIIFAFGVVLPGIAWGLRGRPESRETRP